MGASGQTQDVLRSSLRLSPGCDPSALELSPEEGFLLSRIDGRTSWALLREIGGMAPEAVDHCVERWLDSGLLVLAREDEEGEAAQWPPLGASHRPSPPARVAEPEVALDPSLDLPLEVQRRILAFEARLDLPYHELLGVAAEVDAREVKRAYFKLSREFHPDRYFRRNVGHFGVRLERIFRKILEAHEILSDPMARAELRRSLETPAASPPADTSGPGSPAQLERRLRSFGLHARALLARKQKAKHYFESGMAAFHAERWLEAAASVRLALAFDPGNEAFRESFADVQRRAHEERAKQLVREGEAALDVRDDAHALHVFEEALHFRPHDAALHHRAARLAWMTRQDLRRAKELAVGACDLAPETAVYRRTLGQIYVAAGLEANARRELRRAVELDPEDSEARAELARLGRG